VTAGKADDERRRTTGQAFESGLDLGTDPLGSHFILMQYADGTGAVGGPWTKPQAQQRAAMLYREVPSTVSVQVVGELLPPAADLARRSMAVATYVGNQPGPSRRIVFGWWRSESEARSAAAAILDTAPDAGSDDYEIDVQHLPAPEAG
jgi:hypothetical protein